MKILVNGSKMMVDWSDDGVVYILMLSSSAGALNSSSKSMLCS